MPNSTQQGLPMEQSFNSCYIQILDQMMGKHHYLKQESEWSPFHSNWIKSLSMVRMIMRFNLGVAILRYWMRNSTFKVFTNTSFMFPLLPRLRYQISQRYGFVVCCCTSIAFCLLRGVLKLDLSLCASIVACFQKEVFRC